MKKLTISLFIVLLLILSSAPVAASGQGQYFLNFLYNPASRTITLHVMQDSGIYKGEDFYSMLNTTKPSFLLDDKIKAGDLEIDEFGYKSARPYMFPEFIDTDGLSFDQANATLVGRALTESFNSAVSHILKPVSEKGMDTLNFKAAVN
jgi:hypothetical protein